MKEEGGLEVIVMSGKHPLSPSDLPSTSFYSRLQDMVYQFVSVLILNVDQEQRLWNQVT